MGKILVAEERVNLGKETRSSGHWYWGEPPWTGTVISLQEVRGTRQGGGGGGQEP